MDANDYSRALLDFNWSFLKSDPATIPEIACVFLGGSRLYNPRPPALQKKSQSDYDCVIVCRSKPDIYSLLSDIRRRQCLLNLLGIEREEEGKFQIPSQGSPLYAEFDGVRVSGFDGDNNKRSCKVVSVECFYNGTTSLNILSSKDRRVYDHPGLNYARSMIHLVQSTTFDDFSILHDQWIFTTRLEDRSVLGAFGVTADLILTGLCVYGQQDHGYKIKRILVDHYAVLTGYHPRPDTFTRFPRFSPAFLKNFEAELRELCPDTTSDHLFKPSLKRDKDIFLLGDTAQTGVSGPLNNSLYTRKISEEALAQFNEGRVIKHGNHKPQFSRNSTSYTVTTQAPGDVVDIFVKVTPYANDELNAAKMARRIFPRLFVPRMANSGELLYPLFRGITGSDARLSYIQGERQNMKLVESILHVDLVRAEDTLRTYRNSLSLQQNVPAPRQNIQRFFHDRLVDDKRMREHFGKGITLGGETYSLDQLLSFRWHINGQSIPSLREAFDQARQVIAPDSALMRSCPQVFGLGDSHAANVMFTPSDAKGSPSDVLFIDHEAAGYHPVMLDLAKPFYIDVFFETHYRHLMPGNANRGLRYRVSKSTNTILVELKPRIDALTQAILDIKLRYLLDPLQAEVAKLGVNLEDFVPLLTTALFLCATVGSFPNHESFIGSFATGLLIRQAQNWEELVLRYGELGLKF
ncbi:hypothetical protein O1611_g8004 [Lasiodiplodia mahajangana]|uniref:Uncharacterized protein n=1 Tax=Lasiodiplodia mahajangana TaxID=1108764 RepID=A0ACC2JEK8_9PEZI|nr:hypothetical protein O1611_g8004 [Lasiodiplodia mahajangana]